MKLDEPKISIIMSNYNGEQFIERTIISVLNQTYADYEFIIIDDCSTDRSRSIIDSFEDSRIRKVYFDNNEHMCYAFNHAISIARGKYYARIDSDDYWQPDKLQKQMDYMEGHPECGACFTLVNVVDEMGTLLTADDTDRVKLFEVDNRSRAEWIKYFYFNGSCLCHPSVLMRKEAIEKVGVYNYSLVQIQDFELWIRIVKKYDIYVIQERLTNYRWFISGKNASAPSDTVNRRSDTEFAYVLSRYFDDLSDELFIDAFSDEFVNKEAQSHDRLQCEKALMLLRPVFCGYPGKVGGIIKLMGLIQNENTRKILREEYQITQKNIYKLTALPIFHDLAMENRLKECEEKVILYENKLKEYEHENETLREFALCADVLHHQVEDLKAQLGKRRLSNMVKGIKDKLAKK
ncbi:MAG: glycosyltransferase [Lachnospiraceae bacterium]|nr:glycosyltransferase [Lachnospiraceae bacterium]